MNHQLSSLRAKLLKTQQLLPSLLEECFGREPILPGSLYTLRRKCGNPACRCSRGELHQSTVLSYRGDRSGGRPRNISPAPEHLGSLRELTEHYRRARNARAQLVRWHKQLLQIVDELQAARVQLGEAEFQKLSTLGHSTPSTPRERKPSTSQDRKPRPKRS